MTEPARRRWPHLSADLEGSAPGVARHSHRLPRWMRLAAVGLTLAVLGLAVALALTVVYVLQLKAEREHEADRLAESFRVGICDVLDQLPQGGVLDPVRLRYGCGPGNPDLRIPAAPDGSTP